MAKMTEEKALDFIKKIEIECEKNDIWVDVLKKKRGKQIEELNVSISVKVEKDHLKK